MGLSWPYQHPFNTIRTAFLKATISQLMLMVACHDMHSCLQLLQAHLQPRHGTAVTALLWRPSQNSKLCLPTAHAQSLTSVSPQRCCMSENLLMCCCICLPGRTVSSRFGCSTPKQYCEQCSRHFFQMFSVFLLYCADKCPVTGPTVRLSQQRLTSPSCGSCRPSCQCHQGDFWPEPVHRLSAPCITSCNGQDT